MTTLLTLMQLYAGGPGSGCHGPSCGRPITSKGFKQMKSTLKQRGIKIPRKTNAWDLVKSYDAWKKAGPARAAHRMVEKAVQKKAGAKVEKKLEKLPKPAKLPDKIDVQPVWKGNVKKQYTSQEGHQITILKQPQNYEKSGTTWIKKDSPYKGNFLPDAPLFQQSTVDNPKEKNNWFIHQAAPDKGVSVEIHRNLGSLRVNVIERDLGEYHAIMRHREVSFKNVGKAMGFLNKRYGITFRLKG